jgi:hypothetical protein
VHGQGRAPPADHGSRAAQELRHVLRKEGQLIDQFFLEKDQPKDIIVPAARSSGSRLQSFGDSRGAASVRTGGSARRPYERARALISAVTTTIEAKTASIMRLLSTASSRRLPSK